MRILHFAKRNALEIIRDPLSLIFGVGLPVVLIALLSAIQRNIPVALFEIPTLAPGIAVFSLSFLTLFTAILIARDRGSMLMQRLYTTSLTAKDFILGYMLPVLPMGLMQTLVCMASAAAFSLRWNAGILYLMAFMLPVAFLYVSLGVLFGSILTERQVGGVCGALLTNVSAWLSGIWFDLALVGGAFEKIANALPFAHAVEMGRLALSGELQGVWVHLAYVCAYAAVLTAASVYAFLRQMKK